MKKLMVSILLVVFAFALLAQSKNSFNEVTKHLQKNGEFYLYLSTDDAINGLHKQLNTIHKTLNNLPNIKSEQKKNITNGFKLFNQFLSQSGINDISGFGASAKKDSAGMFENRLFLHHYPKKSNGKLWTAFGTKPHQLDALSFLPSDTILAIYQDCEFAENWKWITKLLLKSGITEVEQQVLKFLVDTNNKGINIDKIFSSINGGAGLIITMDKKKKITIPAGRKKYIKLNAPRIMLFFKTKDDSLFNFIQSKLIMGENPKKHMAKRIDPDGKKSLILKMGIPFVKGPAVVVQTKGYLMIASNQSIIDDALAVKAGKQKGLTSSDEFKFLSQGIPLEGNGFNYVSSHMKKVIIDIQQSIAKNNSNTTNDFMQKAFFNPNDKYAAFSVYVILDDGFLINGKSSVNTATTLSTALFIAPVGIMAGMLLPALSMARESARKISCSNNLKQIGLSCRMYSNVYDEKFPASDGAAGLDLLRSKGFLENPKIFVCPSTSDKCAENGKPFTEKNVSYVFFGGFTEADSPDIPLAFDKPGNHEKYCNILFLDGHVKGYAGNKLNTCKDIVEFLISNNKYSDKVKQILRKKAKNADKIIPAHKGTSYNTTGNRDTISLIANELKFAKSSSFILGQYLAKTMPDAKVLLIVDEQNIQNRRQKVLIDGMKKGFGTAITDVTIKTPQFKKTKGTSKDMMMPLMAMVKAEDFNKLIKQNKSCNLIISMIGLPMDMGNLTIWSDFEKTPKKTPKLAIMNGDISMIYPAIKSGLVPAVVTHNPNARYTEDAAPVDIKTAFDVRYLLITTKNLDKMAKKYGNKIFRKISNKARSAK